jgi:ribonuclease P protein component
VNRKYRLTKTIQIKRVRRLGRSFAHPLVVLIKHPNGLDLSRFGIITGKSIGSAVKRNRRRRQIREILRNALPSIQPGWDIIILARTPLASATFDELRTALDQLFKRAELLENIHVH